MQKFVAYNGKIADITHADTNKHFLDLEAALPETRKIIGILIAWQQMAGSGWLNFYPNEGTQGVGGTATWLRPMLVIIADGTQRVQYALSAANDDYDFYCFGYVVEA